MGEDELIAALDPGVRNVVRWLREQGFETTDSGDGVTKPQTPETLPYPHVACRVRNPAHLITEAHRLLTALPYGWHVEASYNPYDGVALLMAIDQADSNG